MTNLKKIITAGAIVLAIGTASVTAFAASAYKTPAEAAAGLTGRTVESVQTERAETGKSYGTIANEAGKLDEFKKEVLEIKKDVVNKKVADGKITQEQADGIIKRIEDNQAICDGTGSQGICQNNGLGLGIGNGRGQGNGRGNGMGMGRGACNMTTAE